MSTKVKKPYFKKWWFWVIVIIFIGSIIGAMSDSEEKVDQKPNAELSNNENDDNDKDQSDDKANKEANESSLLSDDEISYLENHLKEALEDEQDFGDIFYLEEFGYDPDSNKITARIDMQQDPLPETKEDVIEWAETWAWSLTETTTEVDKPFHVRVTLVTKLDDSDYILWGHSNYDHEKDDYSFREEDGMKLYD